MFEQIVSLLTGILEELKALRKSYDGALAGVKAAIENDKPAKEVKKEQAPAPSPFPTAPVSTAAAQAATEKQQVTRDMCGQALVNLATAKNRDTAVAVLAKFDSKLVKDVKEADLPAFFTAIQEAAK